MADGSRGVPFPKRIRLPAEAYGDRDRVFHVVIRARVESIPFRDDEVAGAVWEVLEQEASSEHVALAAACLMPDHLHLAASPGDITLTAWIGRFKSLSTRVVWREGWRGVLWQPSFFDRYVRPGDWDEVLAYIVNNPVAEGLCDDASTWPWRAVWE